MATISQQKIDSAAQGNASSLREVLNSIAQATVEQQTVTGTTPTQTVAGQPNRNAPVPPQATGSVSLLQKSYILQIVNPGATSPISQIQAAAAGQAATATTNLQAVKAIYHQIRASTSPAFNVNSNTQTFGGNTGSAQTNYTLTGLGTGRWYFQFRSTYDGVNFNTWKNVNQGTSTSEITVEAETNAAWAVFTLPGNTTIGVGQGFGADGDVIGLPQNSLYTSALFSLVSPNGFNAEPPQVTNIATSEIVLQEPLGTSSTSATGTADYPALISMKYGDRNNPQSLYSGNANFFGIAFDPTSSNTTVYDSSDGISSWVVIRLPGGAKIAFGSGQGGNGAQIYVPTQTPWITADNILIISTIQGGGGSGNGAHGVGDCQPNGLTLNAEYSDIPSDRNFWYGVANWLAVAWTPGLIVENVDNGKFLIVNLADGNKIAFGASPNAADDILVSGASFSLPAGFTTDKLLTIASPAGYTGSGSNVMHCVAKCDISGTTATLTYIDGSGNSWGGNVNWFAFCWQNGTT
jgi:hypothetical protein